MSEHKRPPLAAIVAVIVAVQALLMLWFAWPAQEIAPRDLPVVVAGPAPAADALAARLRAERPGAFEVTTVADAAAADAKLRDREAYGAFVAGPDGVTLHVASAASPTVAAALTQAAAPGTKVVDVVPTSADDPRGAGFASGFLPLLLTSIAAGIALALLARSRSARRALLILYGLGAGLVAAALMVWVGLVPGSYLAVAGAVALLTLAVAAAVAGLGAVLGRAGLALGVLLIFIVGNPLSGLASAPELLPQPWGTIGQFLPPGAGATLVRSAGYFDWAGGTTSIAVLLAYALVGLGLVAVGSRRRSPAPPEPARELVPA
jgi:hypothetical protein